MSASKSMKLQRNWEEVAREAQEHRDTSIGKVPGINEGLQRLKSLSEVSKASTNFPSGLLEAKEDQITQCPLPEDLVASTSKSALFSP